MVSAVHKSLTIAFLAVSIILSGEILGFQKAPKLFQAPHYEIQGNRDKGAGGELLFGPAYMYDKMHDSLKFISSTFDNRNEDDLDRYRQILEGGVSADAEGVGAFRQLKQLVMIRKPEMNEIS